MIGKSIAEIREKKGLTLSQLSKLANISKSYLSNIERGINKNPSLEVIQKLAKVLETDLITLLKTGTELDSHIHIEKEWIDFVIELKELGLNKDQIQQYKTLIEFIKWQKDRPDQ
ncbi:helix-turn-helix domain-containing protein [Bacillus massilinigeriensis]|uniref:helix-turn-helix domain-containing protein n=1 Tax=Bacillus massilionigeriensis TaxID=1805475 RepID=UPI00096B0875|nr:helix-turn-helix domain-containing protein [Bacillus massilionigeriensis]